MKTALTDGQWPPLQANSIILHSAFCILHCAAAPRLHRVVHVLHCQFEYFEKLLVALCYQSLLVYA